MCTALAAGCIPALAAAQEAGATADEPEVWETIIQYVLIVGLVMMSGLFSGLTLGLLGLDVNGLKIVIGGNASDSADYKNAKIIQPLREKGNQLLCTLLLGNVAVNALLSILMADLTSGAVGFVSSTAIIVIFGEILPQAMCSRHALYIGAKAVPIVKVIMLLLTPLAWPLSRALDWLLGDELGTVYNTKELRKLVNMHVQADALHKDEGLIMTGAMALRSRKVADVMTAYEDVFSLAITDRLDFKTISSIFQSGCSRVPVRATEAVTGARDEIVGILYTKDLILIDPSDAVPVRRIVQLFERTLVVYVSPTQALDATLALFKREHTHLAVVRDASAVLGIVTLEDVLEEILQAAIIDEFDHHEEDAASPSNARGASSVSGGPPSHTHERRRKAFDYATLRMLDESAGVNDLEAGEVRAIAAHLKTNVAAFSTPADDGHTMSIEDIVALVSNSRVMELKKLPRPAIGGSTPIPAPSSAAADGAAAAAEVGAAPDPSLVYRRGVVDTHCTLVLSGKIEVSAGREGFTSEAGQFDVLAESALTEPLGKYRPDFTARILGDGVRVLRIGRDAFTNMLKYGPAGPPPAAVAPGPARAAARKSSKSTGGYVRSASGGHTVGGGGGGAAAGGTGTTAAAVMISMGGAGSGGGAAGAAGGLDADVIKKAQSARLVGDRE